MSRTVHHIRYQHRDSTREREERNALDLVYRWSRSRIFTAWECHTLYDLRYSAAELVRAERGGRRPRPQRRRHRLEAYTSPRTYGIGHTVSGPSNCQERALRAADRVTDRRVRQVLRGSQDAAEVAWELDFPDPRHRHFAVGDSW